MPVPDSLVVMVMAEDVLTPSTNPGPASGSDPQQSSQEQNSILPDHHPSHQHRFNSNNDSSPFPIATLTRTSTSEASARSEEELLEPDAATALANLHPPHIDSMDPQPSGHRRRRSSMMNNMNNLDTTITARTPRSKRSPRTSNIGEDSKLVDRGSDDDSKSTSDDMELNNLSEEGDLQDDEETGLTAKSKAIRTKKKRRHTNLDHRIAGDALVTAEEKKAADKNVVKKSLINGVLIGLWYMFSLSISLVSPPMSSLADVANCWKYNKWMFDKKHLDFQFPLFTTSRIRDPDHSENSPYLPQIAMCKSSALAFVLLFAFVFRLETPSWRLVGIIFTMTVGVVMMVFGEVDFSAQGFILVIFAAFFSGFRWALTQILLLRNPATSNPFSSIFYLAPIMFMSLLIIATPVEGFPALWEGLKTLVEVKGPVLGPLLLLFPGCIAFCMTASEFALLQRTSVVTLSIAGIFKEVVTISAAGLVFHDPLTPVNISGLFVTIAAIATYNWIKIRKMRADAQTEAHRIKEAAERARGESGSDADGEDGESDWDGQEGSYITSDGDILPNPDRFRAKKGESSRSESAPLVGASTKKDLTNSEPDADVISVHNIPTKLQPHNPWHTTMHTENLYALVDMGSNGIRFSISDLSLKSARLLPCIYRHRAAISLYDALHSSEAGAKEFVFSDYTISEVAKELKSFRAVCNSYPPNGILEKNITVFATEAMRTALNKDAMVHAIKEASRLKVEIVHPQMESLLGAMGARSAFDVVDGVVMDLGGGSVQMTYMKLSGKGQALETLKRGEYWLDWGNNAKSLPFGAAKLSDKIKKGEAGALALRESLRGQMKDTYHKLCENEPDAKSTKTLYLCGGGFRGYGSMLMHTDPIQPYPIPTIAGYKVSGKRFRETKKMTEVNEHERNKIRGMSKRRREQFGAIVEVVDAVVETCKNIEEVIFCGGGNREGVLFLKLPEQLREVDPLLCLPAGAEIPEEVLESIIGMIYLIVLDGVAQAPGSDIFNKGILTYVVKNMWENGGALGDLNATKALHAPIDGPIAGMPGLTHNVIAVLSLTTCARWENDVSGKDEALWRNLRKLLEPEQVWWCEAIGSLTRLLCTMFPVPQMFPVGKVLLSCAWKGGLGKKGKKEGVVFTVGVDDGVKVMKTEHEKFKVGKDLKVDWKADFRVLRR
ncbi:Triose-phosphate transporter protein [Rutstroemia sp. NJR-2017a BVV2]|nr:Triose-phosphate transporter protein [Rutstroemia sp. NJR-2017a BVV2]